MGFHGGSDDKESAWNAGDPSSFLGLGRSPGEGNPLWYSCLENFMDQGAWWARVHGVPKRHDWVTNTHTQQASSHIGNGIWINIFQQKKIMGKAKGKESSFYYTNLKL